MVDLHQRVDVGIAQVESQPDHLSIPQHSVHQPELLGHELVGGEVVEANNLQALSDLAQQSIQVPLQILGPLAVLVGVLFQRVPFEVHHLKQGELFELHTQ